MKNGLLKRIYLGLWVVYFLLALYTAKYVALADMKSTFELGGVIFWIYLIMSFIVASLIFGQMYIVKNRLVEKEKIYPYRRGFALLSFHFFVIFFLNFLECYNQGFCEYGSGYMAMINIVTSIVLVFIIFFIDNARLRSKENKSS